MTTLIVVAIVTILVLGAARIVFGASPNTRSDKTREQPPARFVEEPRRRATAPRPTEPPDGAGPDLMIDYTDAEGLPSTRRISLLSIVQSKEGLLVDFDRIEAWCHKAADQRTFRADRIRSAQLVGAAAPAKTCRLALSEIVIARPELLRRAGPRAQLVWTDPEGATRTATMPTKALVTSAGDRRAEEVTIRELVVTPDGLVLGFRARRATTKRVASFWLRGIKHLADAESGEVVDDTVQGWLKARIAMTPL